MQPGMTVNHSGFGFGTVTSVSGDQATVNFEKAGTQTVSKGTLMQSINS